jgi:hypothetical protein
MTIQKMDEGGAISFSPGEQEAQQTWEDQQSRDEQHRSSP